MLTHRVPCPPDRGDRIRAYHLLRGLSGRFDVTLAAIADEPVTDAVSRELDALCTGRLIVPVKPMRRRALAARAMLTGRAITPAAMFDHKLANELVQLHRDQPFDAVLTFCTGMIGYTQALYNDPQARPFRHVLDLVDVDSLKWKGYAASTRGPMRLVYQAEARRLRAVEAGRVVPFDAATLISSAEVERYYENVTTDRHPVVVGNGVDLDRFYPATEQVKDPVLIFTGVMSYKPNIDAAVWFARKVMPRILSAMPHARFDIVGKSPSPAVMALNEMPGVRVVGPVDDTAESLRIAAVAVAPMAIAPGVQNKVLEAMACGLPVVCSSAAASGIDSEPSREFIVADTERDTAIECVRLLVNEHRRAEVGGLARKRVESRYQWAHAVAPMLDLIDPANHTAPTTNA